MEQELGVNLGLDVDALGSDPRKKARVCVTTAAGFTRGTGAPTLTEGCTTVGALEREVDRLKQELDDVVAAAREALPDGARSAAEATPAAEAPTVPEKVAHIDTSLSVADVMTRQVRTVGRNDALSLADELMKAGSFRHVVVIGDEGGAVRGKLQEHRG